MVEKWAEEEAQFSDQAGGGEFQSLLDVAVNSTIHYRSNISQLKHDKVVLHNELQATHVHVTNLTNQIDFQQNQIDIQTSQIDIQQS